MCDEFMGDKKRFNKKQDSSCNQLVNEAGGHSNAYKCDLLFLALQEHLIFQFIHVQRLYMLIVHLPKH